MRDAWARMRLSEIAALLRPLQVRGLEPGEDATEVTDLAFDSRQSPQMERQRDADHFNVWTSTESTAGRSRTIGAQESPELAEA